MVGTYILKAFYIIFGQNTVEPRTRSGLLPARSALMLYHCQRHSYIFPELRILRVVIGVFLGPHLDVPYCHRGICVNSFLIPYGRPTPPFLSIA